MKKQMMAVLCAAMMVMAAACATTAQDDMSMGAAHPNATPEPDIAGIMMAANEGEVQQGNAASTRAATSQVREFAQMMVTDHTSAINNARDVFGRNNVMPRDNDITSALRSSSQQTVTNLATYTGNAYDRTYMRTQVELHQWLLGALDNALIPSARTAEVRTLLQTQRASVAAHLERARQILAGL